MQRGFFFNLLVFGHGVDQQGDAPAPDQIQQVRRSFADLFGGRHFQPMRLQKSGRAAVA